MLVPQDFSQVDIFHTASEYLILWATINACILWEEQTHILQLKDNLHPYSYQLKL